MWQWNSSCYFFFNNPRNLHHHLMKRVSKLPTIPISAISPIKAKNFNKWYCTWACLSSHKNNNYEYLLYCLVAVHCGMPHKSFTTIGFLRHVLFRHPKESINPRKLPMSTLAYLYENQHQSGAANLIANSCVPWVLYWMFLVGLYHWIMTHYWYSWALPCYRFNGLY